jgi:dTDP-4-dehydrorhamnose 3,5-epimerase
MIEGVVLKKLETHRDERGFFREIIRVKDDFFEEGFGQWSHSLMYPGVIKAWHIHNKQTDWWYVCTGVLKIVLYDKRSKSATYRQSLEMMLGDGYEPSILKIPPGVAHGCKCLSGLTNLLYITSHVYDPEDEGRIPHDDPEIGYDWLQGPAIK